MTTIAIILDNLPGIWHSRKNGVVTYLYSVSQKDLTKAEKQNLNLLLTDCGVPKTSLQVVWKIYSMLKTGSFKHSKLMITLDFPFVKIGYVGEVLNTQHFFQVALPAIENLATTIYSRNTRRANEA
jgi:hypothetical protein